MPNELIGNFSNGAGLVGNLGDSGSGTNNYNDLVNKPSINGVTLAGNKTLIDLGINIPTKVSQLQNDSHYVQQSAIPTKTSQLQNDSGFAYAANLATVAITGSYNNLTDKPTIPAAQVNSDWNSNSGVSQILNKPNLAAVATSGSYDDLTDKPTIPAAQVNSDWNSNSGVSQILNKPTIPAAQVNSDWNSNSGVSQILNKPTIPSNSDFSLAGLSDTTITTPSSGQLLSYDDGKWKNGGAVDVKNLITWNENLASGSGAYRVANMMFISYQGQSKTHSNGETLFVLPVGLRPIQNWEQAFTVDGKTFGQVHVLSNGNVNINNIADDTQTGRIYFSVAYPIS